MLYCVLLCWFAVCCAVLVLCCVVLWPSVMLCSFVLDAVSCVAIVSCCVVLLSFPFTSSLLSSPLPFSSFLHSSFSLFLPFFPLHPFLFTFPSLYILYIAPFPYFSLPSPSLSHLSSLVTYFYLSSLRFIYTVKASVLTTSKLYQVLV